MSNNVNTRVIFYLIINFLLIILAVIHLPKIFNRPKAPFEVAKVNSDLIISQIHDKQKCAGLRLNDKIISWDEYNLPSVATIDFLTSFNKIGDDVSISIERDQTRSHISVTLIPYYPSFRYVFIIIFVGFAIWAVSFFILFYGPSNLSTRTIHWTMTALSISVLMTTGEVDNANIFTYLAEVLLYYFYIFTVAGLFFFSTIFPVQKSGSLALRKLLTLDCRHSGQ